MRFRKLTNREEVTKVYSRAAKSWQSGLFSLGFDTAYDRLIGHALAMQPVKGREIVLDAGCGTAALASSYVAATGLPERLDLLDLSRTMLEEARHRVGGEGETVQGTMGDPKLMRTEYDRIFCGHVLEHSDEPAALLAWAYERLAPGGQLILSVSKPHWCTALVRWRWGNKAYKPEVVMSMLGAAGYGRSIPAPTSPAHPPGSATATPRPAHPDGIREMVPMAADLPFPEATHRLFYTRCGSNSVTRDEETMT